MWYFLSALMFQIFICSRKHQLDPIELVAVSYTHLDVYKRQLLCGWQYGLICGILAPVLSSLFTGMPPAAILPAMLCELAVYGLITGICVYGLSLIHI